MTALAHEVKLQGRAFKELHNTLGTQTSRMAEEIRVAYRDRERDVQRDTERRIRREMLSTLIDLRDRLGRGLDSVRAAEVEMSKRSGGSWLARAFGKTRQDPNAEQLAALTKGYELGLAHLDETLEELNAREIRCDGQPFDPRRMNAIDKAESSVVPEGTVLEVYRTGYEWSGEVFRPAQVKVSCAPARPGAGMSDVIVGSIWARRIRRSPHSWTDRFTCWGPARRACCRRASGSRRQASCWLERRLATSRRSILNARYAASNGRWAARRR